MAVTWSVEKLILLYCPGRGSNSRPPTHHSFKHGKGVLRPYPLSRGGGYYDLSVLSMSVMGFQKKVCIGGGWGELYQSFFGDFLNFF